MKVAGSNYYVWGNGCVFDTGDKIWLGNGNPNGNGEVIKINRGGKGGGQVNTIFRHEKQIKVKSAVTRICKDTLEVPSEMVLKFRTTL